MPMISTMMTPRLRFFRVVTIPAAAAAIPPAASGLTCSPLGAGSVFAKPAGEPTATTRTLLTFPFVTSTLTWAGSSTPSGSLENW